MKSLLGTLGLSSLAGLGLIAAGVLPWGVRAVAGLTFLGLVWLFGLIAMFGVEFYKRLER